MSLGQVAIAELARRVGRCHPVDGFQRIDALFAERGMHLENFENLLCAMSFDKGVLLGVVGRWDLNAEDDLLSLTDLESPGISVEPVATVRLAP